MKRRRTPLGSLVALAALLALLAGLAWPSAEPATARGFLIDVSPGRSDLPLGLPLPVTPDDADGELAGALWEVVRRDLEMTGYFEIIDPDAYLDQSGSVEPGTFRYDDWRTIKAVALAKTRVQRVDGQVQADVYVYDVGYGEKIDARRFVGDERDIRYLGHRVADQVLQALTGLRGVFGTRLAAVGRRSGNKEIYVMDVDGHGVHPVTRNGSINLSPAWSPDDREIAWTSYKRGNPDLYVKDLYQGGSRVLSARSGINTGAAYSPDGSRVALARSHQGDSDIYLVDARSGADVLRLTRGGGIDVAPDFSPDGTRVAFASERSGGSQVYVQPLDGGPARRVTFHGSFNGDPVWSPDGSRIAFVGRDRNFDVFVVGADGKGMVRITQDMGDNEDPSWSPDGRYLVFSSTRSGRSEIWMSTADGHHQVAVTPDRGGWTQPTWAHGKR